MLSVRKQKIIHTPGETTFAPGGIVHQSLPPPPAGTEWRRDRSTKNWELVNEESKTEEWEVIGKGGGASSRCSDSASLGVESLSTVGHTSQSHSQIDYVEHVVLPTDTLQGICIAYRVTATRLRQINGFSGQTLAHGPTKLRIPLSVGAASGSGGESKAFKTQTLARQIRIGSKEARAYLEMADWNLEEAIDTAREDREWEENNIR